MAERLGEGRSTYIGWEAPNPKKPSLPSERGMIRLCEVLPKLTLDYLYRGKMDGIPLALAIRLTARELGLDPDNPTEVEAASRSVIARLSE